MRGLAAAFLLSLLPLNVPAVQAATGGQDPVPARSAASDPSATSEVAEAPSEPAELDHQILWDAAREGDTAKVREQLAAGADPDREFRDGGTALVFAAQRGHTEVVRALLEAGANPDVGSQMNRVSALHFAIGHQEIVRLLTDAGADPNVEDLQVGQTPLGWSVFMGCQECLEALLTSRRLEPRSIESALEFARRDPRRAAMVERLTAALEATGYVPAWPQFRGPSASGIADDADPPLSWDAETGEGLRWKTRIPGLGHSSPVVWGDRVFVTTAVPVEGDSVLRPSLPTQSIPATITHRWQVYCLDRNSGEVLWHRTAAESVPKTGRSPKNSYASETPVTDGQRVVASFGSHGVYAYSMDGELLWKRDLGVMDSGFFFDPGYQWGTASSPVIFRDLVILQVDIQENSFLQALDLASGESRWRTARDEFPSWGTPTVWEGRNEAQVVTNGIKAIRGYNAKTGEELWRLDTHNSMISAATPIAALDLFIVGNGYRPLKPLYAIRTSARGNITPEASGSQIEVAWSTKSGGPYLITPLVYGDLLYVLAENGVLTAYLASSGERVYRQRVGTAGSRFAASPVVSNGRMYLAGEDGDVYVVKAGLEYRELSVNPVGELMMATPAVAGTMVIVRGREHVFGFGG